MSAAGRRLIGHSQLRRVATPPNPFLARPLVLDEVIARRCPGWSRPDPPAPVCPTLCPRDRSRASTTQPGATGNRSHLGALAAKNAPSIVWKNRRPDEFDPLCSTRFRPRRGTLRGRFCVWGLGGAQAVPTAGPGLGGLGRGPGGLPRGLPCPLLERCDRGVGCSGRRVEVALGGHQVGVAGEGLDCLDLDAAGGQPRAEGVAVEWKDPWWIPA